MKKFIILSVILVTASFGQAQDVFSTKKGNISFFSSTPLEDIEAKSGNGVSVLTLSKKDILFTVQIKSFVFDKELMQEHFNENYMESDKYPSATFKGKINEDVDLTKDGEYKVTVTGKLTMHGVSKDRTIPGVIKVSNGTINVNTKFTVACKEHNIEIPTVVAQKIAESVEVTLNADYAPFKSSK